VAFLSCSGNSPTYTSNCTILKAQINGTFILDFSVCKLEYVKLIPNYGIERNLTAKNTINGISYTLQLSIIDLGKGKGTYKLDNKEGHIVFKVDSDPNNTYNSYPSGNITLTEVSDNNWVGTFHGEITCKNTNKIIKISEGKINI
jgi:hypothetical protein